MKDFFSKYFKGIWADKKALFNSNARLEYIDCIRGFTMLLVVYCHVLTNAFGVGLDGSIINSIGLKWRMPTFFFVSGFVACNLEPTKEWFCKHLKRRILSQFLPTFVTGSLFFLYTGKNLVNTFKYDQYKGGYWFTIALFEVFAIFAVLSYFMHLLKIGKRGRCFIYAFVIILSIVLDYMLTDQKELDVVLNIGHCQIFIVEKLLLYLKYFFVGAIAKLYFPLFKRIVGDIYCSSISLILFVIYLGNDDIFSNLVLGLTGIFIVFNLFLNNQHLFSLQTRIGKILSLFGRNTLQIYFLHYFIIEGMSNRWNPDFVKFLTSNWYIELCTVLPISILITISCLIIDKCLQSVPIIHTLMFGPSKSNPLFSKKKQ